MPFRTSIRRTAARTRPSSISLEAPGRRAIESGFVSRDNPDETAKNFFLLNIEAGIDRKLTVCWNIVPWYIGSDTKIRTANSNDTASGARCLNRVISLLHCLERWWVSRFPCCQGGQFDPIHSEYWDFGGGHRVK